MTEFYQSVNKANILAQALFDTDNPREHEEGDAKTAVTEWDIEADNLTCELRRYSDRSGTSFTLEVFHSDEYYEDVLDDTETDNLELDITDEENSVEDIYPIEKYDLSYLMPGTIQKDTNLGNVFMDARYSLDRVIWLLSEASIAQELLQKREADNDVFWKIVGAYALSGPEITQRLNTRRKKWTKRRLVKLIQEKEYGLSKEQIQDAINEYYKSDFGKNSIDEDRT